MKSCTDCFTAKAVANFSPEDAVTSTKKLTRESLDSRKKSSDVQWCYVRVANFTAAMMLPQTNIISIVKVSRNVYSSRVVMDPWKKHRRVLDECKNMTSTNRGFRTVSEQTIKLFQHTIKLSMDFLFFHPQKCRELWTPLSTSHKVKYLTSTSNVLYLFIFNPST